MSAAQKAKKAQAKISVLPARTGLFLLTLTVLLGGVIVYVLIGSTTITITRDVLPVEEQFTVRLVATGDADDAGEDIPSITAELATTSVTVSDTFSPSGEPQRVEQQATGTVTIYNNWSQTQPLAATTRLLSASGVLFRIPERVDVPAGGRITSPIIADQPGTSGEVAAGRFTIPGLWAGLQDKIYAESTEATSGGVVEVQLVSDADISGAQQTLQQQALTAAQEKITALEPRDPSLTLAEDSMQQVLKTTETDVAAGDEVTSFEASRTEDVTAVFLDMQALQRAAQDIVASRLDEEHMLTTDPISLTFSFPDETITLPHTITVTATGSALLTPAASLFAPSAFVSKSRARIEEYFSGVDGVTAVDVHFSPFWVTHAPGNPAQITVSVR